MGQDSTCVCWVMRRVNVASSGTSHAQSALSNQASNQLSNLLAAHTAPVLLDAHTHTRVLRLPDTVGFQSLKDKTEKTTTTAALNMTRGCLI